MMAFKSAFCNVLLLHGAKIQKELWKLTHKPIFTMLSSLTKFFTSIDVIAFKSLLHTS